jgi:hypothetical protein
MMKPSSVCHSSSRRASTQLWMIESGSRRSRLAGIRPACRRLSTVKAWNRHGTPKRRRSAISSVPLVLHLAEALAQDL